MNTPAEQKHRMIEFATIKMTMWAFVVLITGLICALYTAIFLPSAGLLLSFVLLTITVFAAYNINCLFVGNCMLFAKALTVYYVLVLCASTLFYFGVKTFMDKSIFKDPLIGPSPAKVKDIITKKKF